MSPGLGGLAGGLARGISQGAGLAIMKQRSDRKDKAAEQSGELRQMQIDELKHKQGARVAIRDNAKNAFSSIEGSGEDKFLGALDASWKTALEFGDMDAGKEFFTKASALREDLRNKALENADRVYTASGDVQPYFDTYNKYVLDGGSFEVKGKGEDGSVTVGWKLENGKSGEQIIPKAEVPTWIAKLRDPAAMRKMEFDYAQQVRKTAIETKGKIDVERVQGEEARKTAAVTGEEARRTQREKPRDFQFVTSKDADGNETVFAGDKSTGGLSRVGGSTPSSGDGGGGVRKNLPVLNQITEKSLQRWGKVDNSGMTTKWLPTEESKEKGALSERLWLGNKQLAPETVNNIVEKGQHGYAVIEENGKRNRVEVIRHGDQYFRLSDSGGEEFDGPEAPSGQTAEGRIRRPEEQPAGLSIVR